MPSLPPSLPDEGEPTPAARGPEKTRTAATLTGLGAFSLNAHPSGPRASSWGARGPVQFLFGILLVEDSQGDVRAAAASLTSPAPHVDPDSSARRPPEGIAITGTRRIEGNSLFSVIRVNEVVMEVQIIATSIIYFTLPAQGSLDKQPVSLIGM